jgi:DNA-binding ferritin-like protein
MNIYTVRDYLKRTIDGKQDYLEEVRQARSLASREEDHALYATQEFLKINIYELKKILADIEVCCEQATEQSWQGVDRQGGI